MTVVNQGADRMINQILLLRSRGYSLQEIADKVGITRLEVHRILQRAQPSR
jgi:transcriptional regulator